MEKYFKGRYIYKTSIDRKGEIGIKNQCYAFGFLDGFLDEITYRDNIKEECDKTRFNYDKGYLEGTKERLDLEPNEVIKIKDDWVKSLGIYDAENFIDSRVIGAKYKDMYNSYYKETKNRIESNVRKYAFCSLVNNNQLLVKCYSLGYIDGFFEEQVFFNLIPDKGLEVYKKGLIDGKILREEDEDFAKYQKDIWLVKLAKSDVLNGVTGRVLSESAKEKYIKDYIDVSKGVNDDDLDEETQSLLDQEIKTKK